MTLPNDSQYSRSGFTTANKFIIPYHRDFCASTCSQRVEKECLYDWLHRACALRFHIIRKLQYMEYAILNVLSLFTGISSSSFRTDTLKAMPTHFLYVKGVLRYLIGIKDRKLTCCGQRVFQLHVLSEILVFVDLSWADDKNNRRSSTAYYLLVNFATFSR